MADEPKYLAVKNWEKYQRNKAGKITANGEPVRYIKMWTDRDSDPDYSRLTGFQRYVLDACCRLRGRFGRNLSNDPVWLARALCIMAVERHCIPRALDTLISRGFLVPTNLQDSCKPYPSHGQDMGKTGVSHTQDVCIPPVFGVEGQLNQQISTPQVLLEEKSRVEKNREEKNKKKVPAEKAPARPGSALKVATEYAHKSFQKNYKSKPSWGPGAYKAVAALFGRMADLTSEEFSRRWDNFMGSQDKFITSHGGSLMFFCSSFDSFIKGPIGGSHDDDRRKRTIEGIGRFLEKSGALAGDLRGDVPPTSE